jgi:hypothetical protein
MTKQIAQKFNPMQIEEIIDRVVPIIAAPEDYEFFKGILFIKAESCGSSAEFANFIRKTFDLYVEINA